MNIFIMLLTFLFIAGWYFLDSPSQQTAEHRLESAIEKSELQSVVECAATAHSDIMRDVEEILPCAEQYGIASEQVCLSAKFSAVKCEYSRTNKPAFNYIITKSAPVSSANINGIMEALEDRYKNNANFGVMMEDSKESWLMSAGGGKYSVPPAVAKSAKLESGQLVYISQIEFKAPTEASEGTIAARVPCAAGELSVMKYGRWTCAPAGEVKVCTGDTLWNAETMDCVADPRRQPLCGSGQTAVLVDDLWSCIAATTARECSKGMISRLNYNNLEWECIKDPNQTEKMKKCISGGTVVRGAVGSTVRVQTTTCTSCEDSITDMDSCETSCVPSAEKLKTSACYRNLSSCTGSHKAVYFGFPQSGKYHEKAKASVSLLSGSSIPTSSIYSTNRMFNCLDCGAGYIDSARSAPPFVAVCQE